MLVAIIGTVVLIGVFIAVGLWVDKRVSLMPRAEEMDAASKPKPPGSIHEAGAAPQSALRSDPERMSRVLERQRCVCKSRAAMVTDGEDEIRYDAKLLRVIRVRCPACSATRSLYFEPR